MNRLILIGNGLDLAHGLKTSYADFIEWYWTRRIMGLRGLLSHISNDGLCSLKLKNEMDVWDVWAYCNSALYSTKIDGKAIVEEIRKDTRNFSVNFAPMFYEICQKIETKGWVDIEEIYYKHLTQQDSRNSSVKNVNKELDIIKSNLIEYLTEIQDGINDDIIMSDLRQKILEPISKEDIAIGSKNQWEEIMKNRMNYDNSKWEHLIEGYNINREIHHYSVRSVEDLKKSYSTDIIYGDVSNYCPTFRLPDNIMLLNFNYTNTADMYLPKVDKFTINHIHGTISNPESVIFGYGDERDDEYEPLMKKNDNEYLLHIKSFRYLESSNYRKMLEFIELGPYQVCIMGHSCGISDRTLLCTLFEHSNCVSIKPYYYRKKDGSDNYFDLVCSIARNISDPRLMRDRVVRKERCEALGQVREG